MKKFLVRTTIEATVLASNEDEAIKKYNQDWALAEDTISESYKVEAFEAEE